MTVGTVVAFDAARGRGEIECDDGVVRYGFHETCIADGSRTIPVGTQVEFHVAPGPLGRWEAVAVSLRR